MAPASKLSNQLSTALCTTIMGEKTRLVAVQPLSANPARDSQLASLLESGIEVQAEDKTCINDATSRRRTSTPTPSSPLSVTASTKRSNTTATKTSQLRSRKGGRRLPAGRGG
jgi:hypothetical protein